MTPISRSTWLLALFAACILAPGSHEAAAGPDPQGPQNVAVVVAQYQGTTAAISVDRWDRELDDRVNEFYTTATGGRTRWNFLRRAQGDRTVTYPYAYNGKNDDPDSIFIDGVNALRELDDNDPDFWSTNPVRRFLVVVTQPKRGRATSYLPFFTRQHGVLNISLAVISEPAGGVIDDDTISLVCHELGHELFLPDLYREPVSFNPAQYDGPEFFGAWDQMAYDSLQNFSGYSRRRVGWIGVGPRAADNQVRVFGRPRMTSHPVDETFRLSPPQSGGQTELALLALDEQSAIRLPNGSCIDVPRPPGGIAKLFNGYFIEARSFTGADLSGLPKTYGPGILISKTRSKIRAVEVKPRVTLPAPGGDSFLDEAAWTPGTAFNDPEERITITVVREVPPGPNVPEGTYEIRVQWLPMPRADLVAADLWLDAPHNGFSETAPFDSRAYETPLGPDGAPILYGDPPFIPFNGLFPAPATHRLHLRMRNDGSARMDDARGSVFILDLGAASIIAQLLAQRTPRAELDQQLQALAQAQRPNLSFGSLEPGQTGEQILDYAPLGPFFVLFKANDPPPPPGDSRVLVFDALNNYRLESFVVPHLPFGSPYRPIDLSMPVANPNRTDQVFYVTPSIDLPEGWSGFAGLARDNNVQHAALRPGEQETFRVFVQPPDPASAKPPVIQDIGLTAWMSDGDSYVPVAELPVYVVLNYPTSLTLGVTAVGSGKVTFRGELLTHESDDITPRPVRDARIMLGLVGSDGTVRSGGPNDMGLMATTDARGVFTLQTDIRPGVSYQAFAEYGGSRAYNAARSGRVLVGPTSSDLSGVWIASLATASGRTTNLTGTFLVVNQGPGRTKASTVRFFLSTDDRLSDDDISLGGANVPSLTGGASRAVDLNGNLRRGTFPSGRHLIAVVDAGNSNQESDESNNAVGKGPLP